MLYHSHSTNKCIRPTSELDFAVLCGPMVRSFRSTFSAILCERFFHMCAIECMRISFLPHLLQLFLVRICLSARVCRLYECIFIRIGLGAAATSPLGNKLSLNLDLLTSCASGKSLLYSNVYLWICNVLYTHSLSLHIPHFSIFQC